MAALASVAELGAYLKQPLAEDDVTAVMFLDAASDTVRDYLDQILDVVTDDVVVLDPPRGGVLFLPEMPVAAVSKVETLIRGVWTIVDPGSYVVSARTGSIAATLSAGVGRWWDAPWRVTYTHGFVTVPSSLKGVVLGVAGRAYATEVGVDSERIGGYQVKYAVEKTGFSPLELATLNRYRVARVA